MNSYDMARDTAEIIKQHIKNTPQIGIILGSGLGGLLEAVEIEAELDYSEIPNFPVSTVEGHEGKMVFGKLGGKYVALMAGRFHYYEGYGMDQVTFPVRVLKALGAHTLIVSNACGGMNPAFRIGDIMLINDHINLFPEHPLRGANDERLGIRFPDMSEPYDMNLLGLALKVGEEQGLKLHTGVYAGLSGPTFETKAEYKWLSVIGADVVGMSTVPEVIVARHSDMKVLAISVITDIWSPAHLEKITHEEVLEAANTATPKVVALVSEVVKRV